MGTVRYDADRGLWVYGTMAGPARSGDPTWGAFGAGGRFLPSGSTRRRANVGVELGAQGYIFHDAVVERNGSGATIDAIPFVSMSAAGGSLEMRGGWRGHALSYAWGTERRGAFEAGARANYGTAVRFQGDARWVRTSEGTYPYLGRMLYGGAPVELWVQVGKWLSTELDAVAWGTGMGVALGRRATLWASAAHEAPDPLYWNAGALDLERGGYAPAGSCSAGAVEGPAVGGQRCRDSCARVGSRRTTAVDCRRRFVPPFVVSRRNDGMGGEVAALVVS